MSDYDHRIPNDDAVLPNDIQPGCDLHGADLSEADLRGVDLSEADLWEADLSEAYLRRADLSGANLRGADLSNADLWDADLSGTDFRGADLSETYLSKADLSEANLRGADLSEAALRETTLTGVTLSRGSNIDSPGERIRQELTGRGVSKGTQYDTIARANHELREAYSANGLVGRARKARFRERKSRRKEAQAAGGWGTVAWIGSVLSQVFTGYGVRLRWVVGSMLTLYLGSALVYWHWGEMWWGRSLYYSVVTFTTAPPKTPPGGITSIVAGIETFAGTTAIVFLGYVLGTRESV